MGSDGQARWLAFLAADGAWQRSYMEWTWGAFSLLALRGGGFFESDEKFDCSPLLALSLSRCILRYRLCHVPSRKGGNVNL